MSNTEADRNLSCWLRWFAGTIGLLFVLAAFGSIVLPPVRQTSEADGAGTITKIVFSHADVSTFGITVFLTGAGILVFALNGIRLHRFSAAGMSAEGPPTGDKVKQSVENAKDLSHVADEDAPEPTELSSETVRVPEGDEYEVFNLTSVPAKVIRDALQQWSPKESLPDDLSSFEYALRKRGRGNNPWFLKFRGKQSVKVTYGGRPQANQS